MVVAIGKIVMRVRAATLVTSLRADHRGHRVAHQVLQLQRLHQVAVPDQAVVGEGHVLHAAPDPLHFGHAVRLGFAVAEYGGVRLHGALHIHPQVGHLRTSLGVTRAVEPVHRRLAGLWR